MRLNDAHDASTMGTELNATIAKIYEPSTASVIMEVVILTAQNTVFRAVLKLFDRRFCPQLRKDLFLQPYSSTLQAAYLEFIRTSDASRYLARLHNSDSDRSSDEVPMADCLAENEVYLQHYCLGLYENELSTYKRLQDLQGSEIPQLFTSVNFLPCTPEDIPPEFMEVKGILIEFISGFSLAELSDNAPREFWQTVCDQAVQIVHRISDHDILNEDTDIKNFMVTPSGINAENAYRVVMLDFADCRFRHDYESDDECAYEKRSSPDEEAIGAVMQDKLKKAAGFHLNFQESQRFFRCGSWKEEEDFEQANAAALEARQAALELGSYDGRMPFVFSFQPNVTVTLPPFLPMW